MTAYTKTTPGKPQAGAYSMGDVVLDSTGIVWQCVRTGIPGEWLADSPRIAAGPATASAAHGVVATVTGLSGVEYSAGLVRHTRLTLAGMSQTITNGASEFVGTTLYTFPEGRIFVLGSISTLAPTTTSTLATTITSGSSGAVALGTVAASNASLTGTMVDLAPSTAYTSSTTINVAAAAVSPVLAAAAQFDGTATAKVVILNNSVATNSADGTMTWAGTIDLVWMLLGDK